MLSGFVEFLLGILSRIGCIHLHLICLHIGFGRLPLVSRSQLLCLYVFILY